MIETKKTQAVRLAAEAKIKAPRIKAYAKRMNLPVPVLAEPPKDTEGDPVNLEKATSINRGAVIDTEGQARESTQSVNLSDGCNMPKDSRGGQKFDRLKYQRDLMRKRRATTKGQI